MAWGPRLLGGGRARFRLWAPDKSEITLELDGASPIAMEPGDDGWFSVITEAGPGARYRFRVEQDLAVPDPASRWQSGGVHGWSVLADPTAYRWRCSGWRGRAWKETVIEEVHAGVLGGFSGLAERLPEMA